MPLNIKIDAADIIETNEKQFVTAAQKAAIGTGGTGGGSYVLPSATATVLGGIRVGSGLVVNNGILSVTSSGGGGGGTPYGNVIMLPHDTYIKEIRTSDYGKIYSNGKTIGAYYGSGYEHQTGTNFGSDAADNIYQVAAYNITPKGNRVTNDGAWWFGRIERHFDISSTFLENFEPHIWGFQDYAGNSHRSLSGYFSKLTGTGFFNMEANIFRIDSYKSATKKTVPLMVVNDGLLNLYATENQIGINLHNQLGEYAAYMRFTGGYTQIKLNRAVFANNTDGKNSGLKAGEEYATRINGILVTAIVE